MDARLWKILGQKVQPLTRADTPNLAKAIVAYMRRLPGLQVHAGQAQETSYVLFQGQKGAFFVVVRGDDWSKILPFIKSDALSPPAQPLLNWGEGVADLSNIDVYDSYYYNLVLGVLNGIFTQDFPTSYL